MGSIWLLGLFWSCSVVVFLYLGSCGPKQLWFYGVFGRCGSTILASNSARDLCASSMSTARKCSNKSVSGLGHSKHLLHAIPTHYQDLLGMWSVAPFAAGWILLLVSLQVIVFLSSFSPDILLALRDVHRNFLSPMVGGGHVMSFACLIVLGLEGYLLPCFAFL
ncbi:hypothetical protein U1Q18_018796 [Sarracenia purpurea var. burkii]